MRRIRAGAALGSTVLCAALLGFSSSPTHHAELFSAHDPVEFVLEADWDELDGDRGRESDERPGQVMWTSPDGEEFTIPIEIKTRGNFRLQKSICFFPPVRLDFPSAGTERTVFSGQDKVKMVTHCRDRDSYEQNMLEEYLAYRAYNLLTDKSLLVRPARITYVDTRGSSEPITRMAFLIEDEDAMADRVGGRIMDVPGAPPSHFHQNQAALMYIFQFMIGNTDWAVTEFHNLKALGVGRDFYPVPYDFDWAGLVDAPYAGPNPRLGNLIDSVRERLYLGWCNRAIDYPSVFDRFKEKREAILALPGSVPGLSERNRKRAVGYLEGFFEVIDGEHAARIHIMSKCRN